VIETIDRHDHDHANQQADRDAEAKSATSMIQPGLKVSMHTFPAQRPAGFGFACTPRSACRFAGRLLRDAGSWLSASPCLHALWGLCHVFQS
jgi:hypothetical protein